MNVIALLGGVRATLFAVLAALALTWGGIQTARLKYLEARHHKMLADFGKAQAEAQIKNKLLADELAELKKRAPKAGKTVREYVNAHPTDCTVPAAPSLQDAIREGNTARSGT